MAEIQSRESRVGDVRAIRTTRPLRRTLLGTLFLVVLFVVYTALVIKWQPFVRLDDTLNRNFHVHAWWPLLHVIDRIGQRAVCLPILTACVVICAWRQRTWRPVLLSVSAVFLVNLIVLIAKLAFARGRPLMHEGFFTDGDDYPSGHTANVIVVYGLCYSVVTRYGPVGPKMKRILFVAVCALSVVMFWTSLLLRWHWFSDLMAGFMVGGGVLLLLAGIDAWVPFESSRLVVTPVPVGRASPPPLALPASAGPTASEPVGVGPATRSRLARLGGYGDRDGVSASETPSGSPAPAADRPSRR